MTANHSPGDAHVDADLIRWLDGELDGEARSRVEAALAAEPALAARLEQLRRRDGRLRELLKSTDPSVTETQAADPTAAPVVPIESAMRATPPPGTLPGGAGGGGRGSTTARGRPALTWLRAAAVLALLAGAAMAVPPVRAWVVDRLQRIAGSEIEPSPAPDPALPAPPADTLAIAFPAAGPIFEIEVATRQAAGRLRVTATDASQAGAEIQGRRFGESLLVLPHGLRIENRAGSTADYEVSLPSGVATVEVRVGGIVAARFEMTAADPGRAIDLARPPPASG